MKLNEEFPWKIYPMTAKPTAVITAMHVCTHMLDRRSPYLTSQLQLWIMGRRLPSYLVVEISSAVHLPLLTLETAVFLKPFQRKYSQLPFKKHHKKKKKSTHLHTRQYKNIFSHDYLSGEF